MISALVFRKRIKKYIIPPNLQSTYYSKKHINLKQNPTQNSKKYKT